MKTQMIDLSKLELATLAEMANDAAEQAENNAKATVQRAMDAGRFLNAAKEQCEYGTWLSWLGANWNYKHATASAYMQIANFQHAGNLKDAKSIREALRMIGEEKEDQPDVVESAIVPRAERKTGRVEVQEVGQTVVQAEEVKPEKDDDPNPAPKTNTKHTPATAKAKEADRQAPMTITPVIIEEPPAVPDEPTLADWSVVELLTFLKSSADDPKKRARELRKAADELDPPTKFIRPTVEDVAEYCQQRKNNIDAEMFVAHYAANGWKLANGNKLNDWKSAVITWEKRNDSGSQQSGRAIAGTGRIKPGKIDESQIEWR
jgi:hypothetical protein